jgi:hypothetical protein
VPPVRRRDRPKGGERGAEGVALVEKRPANLGQKPAGPFVISEADGEAVTRSRESPPAPSDRADEAVRLLQDLNGRLRFAHLGE